MINKDKLKKDLKLYLVTDSKILKDRDFYRRRHKKWSYYGTT